MEDTFQEFLYLMKQKRYVGDFSLFRDYVLSLKEHASLSACIEELSGLKSINSPLTLVTNVKSSFKGKALECTFFIDPNLEEGIKISKMIIIPPFLQESKTLHFTHNKEIPAEALIPNIFPSLSRLNSQRPTRFI